MYVGLDYAHTIIKCLYLTIAITYRCCLAVDVSMFYVQYPCGGGLEYFHLSPTSLKKPQKRNPVSNETSRYGLKFCRTWIREWPLTRPSSTCKNTLQTHPLVREGTQYWKTRKCLKIISKTKKKIRSRVRDGGLIPGLTGWLTVGRKITLTLTLSNYKFYRVEADQIPLPYPCEP
jgi:hypothetical protein